MPTAIKYKSESSDEYLRLYEGGESINEIVDLEERWFGEEFAYLDVVDVKSTDHVESTLQWALSDRILELYELIEPAEYREIEEIPAEKKPPTYAELSEQLKESERLRYELITMLSNASKRLLETQKQVDIERSNPFKPDGPIYGPIRL